MLHIVTPTSRLSSYAVHPHCSRVAFRASRITLHAVSGESDRLTLCLTGGSLARPASLPPGCVAAARALYALATCGFAQLMRCSPLPGRRGQHWCLIGGSRWNNFSSNKKEQSVPACSESYAGAELAQLQRFQRADKAVATVNVGRHWLVACWSWCVAAGGAVASASPFLASWHGLIHSHRGQR